MDVTFQPENDVCREEHTPPLFASPRHVSHTPLYRYISGYQPLLFKQPESEITASTVSTRRWRLRDTPPPRPH